MTASFSGDSFTGNGEAPPACRLCRMAATPVATANVTLTNTSIDSFAIGIDDQGGTVTFNAGNSITNVRRVCG